MNKDALIVLRGFFQLPNLQKKKVVDLINDYFDSLNREAIRSEIDQDFENLRDSDMSFECKCCGRGGSVTPT